MSITYGDHLTDIGYHDITAEQERELEAREECERLGVDDPDEVCADGGVLAWMVVDQEMQVSIHPRAALKEEVQLWRTLHRK